MSSLTEEHAEKNPFRQFDRWFKEVLRADFVEPTAAILATSSGSGKPSARAVLIKEYGQDGFVFYTNYQSRKGRELGENPNATLLFYWDRLVRQVRIEGKVAKVSAAQSDNYFDLRPRESRIGAIASPQSEVIRGREELEKRVAEIRRQYEAVEKIPRPPYWGGYILKPAYFEFWQGRENRLHDRIIYVRAGYKWSIRRLAP